MESRNTVRPLGDGTVEVTSESGNKAIWTVADLPTVRCQVRHWHKVLDRALAAGQDTEDIASISLTWYVIQCELEGFDASL